MIVSGVVNQTDIDALMKAGADDFLRKPFNLQQLMSRVSTLLHV